MLIYDVETLDTSAWFLQTRGLEKKKLPAKYESNNINININTHVKIDTDSVWGKLDKRFNNSK